MNEFMAAEKTPGDEEAGFKQLAGHIVNGLSVPASEVRNKRHYNGRVLVTANIG